jgi:hypothetical protein
MNHLERLKQRLRGKRTLFRKPAHAGDMGAILHNEWSLIIFAEYLASRRTREGRRLAVDTVAEYVSMAKVELSVSYGFAIAGEPQRLPHIIKAMRRRRQRPCKQRRASGAACAVDTCGQHGGQQHGDGARTGTPRRRTQRWLRLGRRWHAGEK